MKTILLLLAGALLIGGTVATATEKGSATFADAVVANLGGSWLVQIEGEKRPRTLTVFGLAKMGFGAAPADTATLQGSYGFADSTLHPTRITAHGSLDEFEIAFTSSARAQVRARTVSPTELRGTFEFKGQTRPVVIRRAPVTATARPDSRITLIYIGAFD